MRKDLYEDLYNLESKHWWHISKRRAVRQLIEKYNFEENPQILDIGCGTGKNMEELQNLGSVSGLDSSNEALKYCKKRGLNKLILGTAEKTSLGSSLFDVITLLDVLEHTEDNETLKEMNRILRKNGIIIITVPAFSWLWSNWDVILHHKRRYTKNSLKEVLEKNNFEIVKISYLYSFLVIPAFFVRKLKQYFFKEAYPSDFKLSNPFINMLLGGLSQIELLLSDIIPLSFGTSIFAVAKKNK